MQKFLVIVLFLYLLFGVVVSLISLEYDYKTHWLLEYLIIGLITAVLIAVIGSVLFFKKKKSRYYYFK
ncbi:MAG TPA: hypothetical protein QF753_15685 [Victivallales bacterium]|nr:hypothetical protein [Victivallales bacterium]